MKNVLLFVSISVLVLFSFACGNTQGTNTASNVEPEIQKDAKPVADDEVAVIEMENSEAYGTITIELYSNIAPKTVARFKELAKEGFFNGIAFHRINNSVIQVGDPRFKNDANPTEASNDANKRPDNSEKPNVEAEFSDVKYDTGIVGAARLPNDFNSANSQFFITLKREQGFDNKYTVFGKVIDGMTNARTVAGAPTNGEKPIDDIRVKEIKIQPKR